MGWLGMDGWLVGRLADWLAGSLVGGDLVPTPTNERKLDLRLPAWFKVDAFVLFYNLSRLHHPSFAVLWNLSRLTLSIGALSASQNLTLTIECSRLTKLFSFSL